MQIRFIGLIYLFGDDKLDSNKNKSSASHPAGIRTRGLSEKTVHVVHDCTCCRDIKSFHHFIIEHCEPVF